MTLAPPEAVEPAEADAFIEQVVRLGETVTAQMLAARGVRRFSHLRRVDRIVMLAEMKRTRRL